MQVIGDPFAFILPDGDLGKDLFPQFARGLR